MVEPGTHGSTYGGNPLGCAVSLRALELIEEEDMTAKAEKLGNIFRAGVTAFNTPIVQLVRGKGLLNAVVIDESAANGRTAWDLCILLKEKGLLVSSSPVSVEMSSSAGHRLPCLSSPPLTQVPLHYTGDTRENTTAKQVDTNTAQAKPTHGNIIRFAPPLVITEAELQKALGIIGEALKELPNAKHADH